VAEVSDSGYWSGSGRHRPDAGPYDREDADDQHGYNGREESYQDSAAYRRPAWHDAQDRYGSSGGYGASVEYGAGGYGDGGEYGSMGGYGENGRYADPRYRAGEGYADPADYGGQPGYGTDSYGEQSGYERPGGYGSDGGYVDPADYGSQGGFGQGGYGDRGGYQAHDSYGGYGTQQTGRGRHSAGPSADPAGQDSFGAGEYDGDAGDSQYGAGHYGAGGYGAGEYGAAEYGSEPGYGPADPYGTGSFSSYGYDDLGRGQGATSSYQWQDQYGQTDPLTGSFRADDTGSYDSGRYDPAAHDPAMHDPGAQDNGATGSRGSWAFTPGDQQQDYNPGTAEPMPGEAAGEPGADSGIFPRPDTGSLDRADTGAFPPDDSRTFGRQNTGSFRRADSGAFGRIDTGSFDRDEEFRGGSNEDADPDSGSLRWTSGPPPLRARSDRDGDDAVAGRGAPLDEAGDGADWRDDAADGDWQDEADDGLLSRRFGRDGEPPEPDGGGRRRARGRKKRRIRGKAAVTAAILAVALIVGVAGIFGYRFVHSWISNRYGDYTGAGTGTVEIIVNPGEGLVGLGPQLLKKHVILTERPYDTAAAAAAAGRSLQPGIYHLHLHMNSALAVQYLLSSDYRSEISVRIGEGARASAIAEQLSKAMKIPVSAFEKLIEKPPASLGLPSWAPPGVSAEGFLFPDTYNFSPRDSALKVLKDMVGEFNSKTQSIHLVSEAKKVFTTPWHALIVASMVQAEAGNLSDMPKISRVAWNRLKINKPLQFDSTVFYALHQYGTAITTKQEQFKSPYNTYLHAGLPPTPIGNPGLDAILAAVHPVKAGYLYFITDTRRKPPVTFFTASLKKFQEWQQKFQN
jgi:uncharacterized YceG family protein